MEERSRMRKGREHPAERDPTNDDDEDVHIGEFVVEGFFSSKLSLFLQL